MFQEEYPLGWKVGIGFLGAVVGGVVGAVVVFLFMRRNAEGKSWMCDLYFLVLALFQYFKVTLQSRFHLIYHRMTS